MSSSSRSSSISKSTSSSSPRSDSTGGVYTFKLFFYLEVDSPQGKEYSMTNQELGEKLRDNKLGELLDEKEQILEVFYYKHPLNNWQMTKDLLHHAYIVFETKNWWWSIEKNDAGITIQRSKKIESVRDKYYRVKRQEGLMTGISKGKSKTVTFISKTVRQLFAHVYNEKYVDEEYSVVKSNCQHFALKIYDFFY